jgi:hypothetical protein
MSKLIDFALMVLVVVVLVGSLLEQRSQKKLLARQTASFPA